MRDERAFLPESRPLESLACKGGTVASMRAKLWPPSKMKRDSWRRKRPHPSESRLFESPRDSLSSRICSATLFFWTNLEHKCSHRFKHRELANTLTAQC